MIYITEEQGSLEWQRLRLGRVTSTAAAALMTKARKEGEISSTAKAEIYRLKAERNLRKVYKNEKLQEYLDRTNVFTKAMEFGKTTEQEARKRYALDFPNVVVTEVAFITAEDEDLEPFWGDSPDGLIFDEAHVLTGCIEIKCPKPATFMEYSDRLSSGESLKVIEPKYWWQVINHLAVSGALWCDFIIYDPMIKNGYKCTRINRADVEADITALTEKVKETIKLLCSTN